MQQLRSAIHNAIARFLKNQPPARIIAVGFALLILLGAALLTLPFASRVPGSANFADALFTATADYKERREAGVPFQVGKDADEWKPSTAE